MRTEVAGGVQPLSIDGTDATPSAPYERTAGATAPRRRPARPFSAARRFVHMLGLQTPAAWRAWARSDQRPADIPRHPQKVYRHRGWAGWGDWFGTPKRISRGKVFRP